MKKLTLAQAAKEINSVAKQRLTTGTPIDNLSLERIAQFTEAVESVITQLQEQIQELQKQVAALKK